MSESRTVSVGFDVMAAAVIAAIDQHVADAGFAHLAEGDLLLCVKLSWGKAASSNVFLASVGARQRTDGASLYSFWARMYNVANVKR